MAWYGTNNSGREHPWCVGDLVRYDDGDTALMRITYVQIGTDSRGIACEVRYYGRAFHSEGTCTGRYHGQCYEPTEADLELWNKCHYEKSDQWVRGMWK